MRSEIRIQLAGLLIDVETETPKCSVASPYHVFFEKHVFSEYYVHRDHSWGVYYQIDLDLVETESRNFSDLEVQRVYRWQ